MPHPPLEYVAFQTHNGSYLSAENGGGRELVANGAAVGAWEVFRLRWVSDHTLALQVFNGQFVCAEVGGADYRDYVVKANRHTIGPCETFTWLPVSIAGDFTTAKVALLTSEGWLVAAENGGGGEVTALRTEIGPSERFRIVTPPSSVLRIHGGWGH